MSGCSNKIHTNWTGRSKNCLHMSALLMGCLQNSSATCQTYENLLNECQKVSRIKKTTVNNNKNTYKCNVLFDKCPKNQL